MNTPSNSPHFPDVPGYVKFPIFVSLCILVGIFLPWRRPTNGPRRYDTIVQNLRQIDSAKQLWAVEHHVTNDVVITEETIAPYFKLRPVAAERYTINTLWKLPEAELTLDIGTLPKGTLIRFGTNGIEIIKPNQRVQATPDGAVSSASRSASLAGGA